MLKYTTHDIVFQEYPDEVTLALNLSLCPNRCVGCHSAYLRRDTGEELTRERLAALIAGYENEITCVGLMGGDNDPAAVAALLAWVKSEYKGTLKTGWYSGRQNPPEGFDPSAFDYVKLGPYRPECGPLSSESTNQRMYRVSHPDGTLTDITHRFRKKLR